MNFKTLLGLLLELALLPAFAQDDNAAGFYNAAAEKVAAIPHAAKLKGFSFSYIPDHDWDQWHWLAEEHGVLPLLRQAVALEHCRFLPDEEISHDQALTFAAPLRSVMRYLVARGGYAFHHEDYAQARECFTLTNRLAFDLMRQPWEMTAFFGLAFEQSTAKGWLLFIEAPVAEQKKTLEAVNELAAARPDYQQVYRQTIEAMMPSLKRQLSSQMEALGGQMPGAPEWLTEVEFPQFELVKESLFKETDATYDALITAAGLAHYPAVVEELASLRLPEDKLRLMAMQLEMIGGIEDHLSEAGLEALKNEQPIPKADQEKVAAYLSRQAGERTAKILMDMIVGIQQSGLGKNLTAIMHYDMIALHLALELYQHQHGVYPETLEALIPEFFSAVPRDCFTADAPLRYQRTDDGYLFYSVGRDMKDDGGEERYPSNQPDIVGRRSDFPRHEPPPPPRTDNDDGLIFLPVSPKADEE